MLTVKIRFLEIAQIELDEAIEYYDREEPGLGNSFLDEVVSALDRIGRFPQAWPQCSRRARRCQTRRFPYGIIYQWTEEEIVVVAVAHLHREPDYWNDRIGPDRNGR